MIRTSVIRKTPPSPTSEPTLSRPRFRLAGGTIKTFASHVRDRLRSSHPSPMQRSPAPDLVDRSEKHATSSGSTGPWRLAAPKSDDRTHSLFTMSNNRLAIARAKRRSGLSRTTNSIMRTRGLDTRSTIRATIRPPSSVLARLGRAGGARRDRTDDLMLAKHALSQLSYGPGRGQTSDDGSSSVLRRPSSEPWWAWEDSNFRPHAYQARALTN